MKLILLHYYYDWTETIPSLDTITDGQVTYKCSMKLFKSLLLVYAIYIITLLVYFITAINQIQLFSRCFIHWAVWDYPWWLLLTTTSLHNSRDYHTVILSKGPQRNRYSQWNDEMIPPASLSPENDETALVSPNKPWNWFEKLVTEFIKHIEIT